MSPPSGGNPARCVRLSSFCFFGGRRPVGFFEKAAKCCFIGLLPRHGSIRADRRHERRPLLLRALAALTRARTPPIVDDRRPLLLGAFATSPRARDVADRRRRLAGDDARRLLEAPDAELQEGPHHGRPVTYAVFTCLPNGRRHIYSGQPAKKCATSPPGPFRYVRHPNYAGARRSSIDGARRACIRRLLAIVGEAPNHPPGRAGAARSTLRREDWSSSVPHRVWVRRLLSPPRARRALRATVVFASLDRSTAVARLWCVVWHA